MTCIMAIKNYRGKILLGSDRRLSFSDGFFQSLDYAKSIKSETVMFGGAGTSVLCSVVCSTLDNISPSDYVIDPIDRIRKRIHRGLVNAGYATGDGQLYLPDGYEVNGILVVESKAYTLSISNPEPAKNILPALIEMDEVSLPYAVGSGAQFALGALRALEVTQPKMRAKEKLQLALDVTSQVCISCDNNIDILLED
jgi:ATP-dependent protease HslVU (ClpYQ) peptidase subunit